MIPMNPRRLALLVTLALLATAGCRTVEPGPGTPGDPTQQGVIYAREPEHAPIPQKDVPAGESSLSHRKPDQRIDRP